jgi:hypothetical protein
VYHGQTILTAIYTYMMALPLKVPLMSGWSHLLVPTSHGWIPCAQHCKLFMPTWDISELLAANEELELNINTNEINNRFALFGGSARYCLSVEDEFVSAGKLDIESALAKINGFDQLRDCFFGNADLNTVVHRLMYYCPENNPIFATLSPESKLIDQILVKL